MPTYDYQCKTCGKTFEVFQSMSSAVLTHCPTDVCDQIPKGEGVIERKISAGAGLIFNGSGFYLTDYKASGAKSAATTGTASGTSSDATASKSSGSDGAGGSSENSTSSTTKTSEPSSSASKSTDSSSSGAKLSGSASADS